MMSGPAIHEQFREEFGGDVAKIRLGPTWPVSDDTVMSIATAEAMNKAGEGFEMDTVMAHLVREYIACTEDMGGRAPGPTTMMGIARLRRGLSWKDVEYSRTGGGCGGSMRAMPIGLRYAGASADQRRCLVAVGIESGRLTHAHPTGYMGSLVSALFTAFAVEGLPVVLWGSHFLEHVLPLCEEYLSPQPDWDIIGQGVAAFAEKWRIYLKLRGISGSDASQVPQFPDAYGVLERDQYYTSLSYDGWGGASGDDSVIISYDALLGSAGDWSELVKRGVLHGGDNDSTGAIAGAWFGAIYGLAGVPKANIEHLEKRDKLETLGSQLYKLYQNEAKTN
eukprot:TRINITY_DN2301_c0_g1_i2.p1 TRINITY_DN2301_c0_g1~~TRINITY_DN2301_c0_g1_i2.p1  ORF type:complete len:336 (+),score=70.39 TRINITY_DN2301_c0_g1_i2:119-1126(+)